LTKLKPNIKCKLRTLRLSALLENFKLMGIPEALSPSHLHMLPLWTFGFRRS